MTTRTRALAGWDATFNLSDDCVDIDYQRRPVDAFNEIGWSEENLDPKNKLFIPYRVRYWAETIWLSKGRELPPKRN